MRTQDHGFKFAGNVQVRNRREAGSGFYDIGNTTALKTTQSADTKERVSRRKETHGRHSTSSKPPSPSKSRWSWTPSTKTTWPPP